MMLLLLTGTHTTDAASAPACGRCPKLKRPQPGATHLAFSVSGVESAESARACGLSFPPSLVQPRYSFTSAAGVEILAGPLCGNSLRDACEVEVPSRGVTHFRVSGFTSERAASSFRWELCGVSGSVGAAVTFKMRGKKCVVLSVDRDTQAYASVTATATVTTAAEVEEAGVLHSLTESVEKDLATLSSPSPLSGAASSSSSSSSSGAPVFSLVLVVAGGCVSVGVLVYAVLRPAGSAAALDAPSAHGELSLCAYLLV